MIEKERAEFGCFSTQISREWHMGHAARASIGLGSGPRPSRGPRLLERFMVRGPIAEGSGCLDQLGSGTSAPVVSPGLGRVANPAFDDLRPRFGFPFRKGSVADGCKELNC